MHVAVTAHPTAEWTAQQLREAFPWDEAPRYLIHDRDHAFDQLEVTAKAMTPDGYYRTGDVFRRDENGFFFFVGRADDMFVCGGENIYPGEVEKMLERHPGIHQAAVIPIPDELKGHKPIAFVVRANGADLDEQAVKSYALTHAPAYHHPRQVIFIDEMPLAGTNKIDKRVLAQHLAKQIPTGGES